MNILEDKSSLVLSLCAFSVLAISACNMNENHPPAPAGVASSAALTQNENASTPTATASAATQVVNAPMVNPSVIQEPAPNNMVQFDSPEPAQGQTETTGQAAPVLTSVTAVQRPDFSYDFLITGDNFMALNQAETLQVEVGGHTASLISLGQSAEDLTLTHYDIDENQIYFNWKYPGAPTDRDRVQLDYIENFGGVLRESNTVDLAVPFDGA